MRATAAAAPGRSVSAYHQHRPGPPLPARQLQRSGPRPRPVSTAAAGNPHRSDHFHSKKSHAAHADHPFRLQPCTPAPGQADEPRWPVLSLAQPGRRFPGDGLPIGVLGASLTEPRRSASSSVRGPSVVTTAAVMAPGGQRAGLVQQHDLWDRSGPPPAPRALLTPMPSSAPRPTVGQQGHRGGQAERARAGHQRARPPPLSPAAAPPAPAPSQNPSVTAARVITRGTKTAAIRSASRWAEALVPGLRRSAG